MSIRISRFVGLCLAYCSAVLVATACGDPGAGGALAGPGPVGSTAAPLASASASSIIGQGDAPTATEVTVHWRAVDSSKPLDGSGLLYADLVNETDSEQAGKLVVVGSGLDGRLVQRPLGTFRLAAHATQAVSIRVDALPIQSESSSSFAVIQAEVTRADGFVLRVPTDPLYFHFQSGYRQAFFYPPEQVPAKAPRIATGSSAAAEVAGRVQDSTGAWTSVATAATSGATAATSGAAAAGGAAAKFGPTTVVVMQAGQAPVPPATGAVTAAPAAPAAAVVNTVCATWRVQYVDSGYGEDFLASNAWQDTAASFGFVYLYVNGTAVWSGNLDVNGCVLLTMSANTTYAMYVTGASMTWSGGPVIDDYLIQNGSRTLEYVSGSFTTPATGTTLRFNFTYNDDLIQANAVASAVLASAWRTNQGTIASHHYIVDVHATECGPATDPSCPFNSGGVVKIGLNQQQNTSMTHWKFMIAHELGHAVQSAFIGTFEFAYNWQGAPNLCTCNAVPNNPYSNTHCMQSRGDIGAGQIEGFAHAFSSRVFNRDSETGGTFIYYKPFLSPYSTPNPTLNPPILFPLLWDAKFMSNYCGAAGKGVELDWMEFFYQVTAIATPNRIAVQDLFFIYRYACTGGWYTNCSNQTVTWSAMLNAAQQLYGAGDARYATFRDTGTAAGVNW